MGLNLNLAFLLFASLLSMLYVGNITHLVTRAGRPEQFQAVSPPPPHTAGCPRGSQPHAVRALTQAWLLSVATVISNWPRILTAVTAGLCDVHRLTSLPFSEPGIRCAQVQPRRRPRLTLPSPDTACLASAGPVSRTFYSLLSRKLSPPQSAGSFSWRSGPSAPAHPSWPPGKSLQESC